MDVRLYINGQLADLLPDTVIAMTFQVNDIGELKDRQASYSNRIKLPKSKTNNNILEQANVFGSGSTKPYEQLSITLVQQGIPIVENGIGVLDSVSDVYELVIYSGLLSFFDSIGDDKLRDLELNLDHVRNYDTIKASLNNTTGYIYAIADYFSDTPNTISNLNTDIDVRYLFPVVYLRTIWDAIFNHYGFSWTGDIANDSRFNTQVIPVNQAEGNPDINNLLAASGASLSDAPKVFTPVGLGGYVHLPDFATFTGNENDNIADRGVNITGGGLSYTGNLWTYQVDVSGTYSLEATFNYVSNVLSVAVIGISVLRASAPTTRVILEQQNVQTSGTHIETLTYSGEFQAGDLIFIEGSSLTQPELTLKPGCELNVTAVELTYEFGSKWFTSLFLPDITIKDFIKGVAQMYGLVFDRANLSNEIQVFTFESIRGNIPNAIDWSDKLDMGSINTSFVLSGYGQRNWLRYEDDETLIDSTAWDGFITSNNQNLKRDVDIITPGFAGSDEVPRLGGVPIINIPLFEFEDDSSKYKPTASVQPRTAIVNGSGIDWDITDGTSTDTINNIPVVQFIRVNTLNGQQLLTEYYPTITNMLQNTKAITAKFLLTGNDIKDIDFSIPRYISYFGAYFYLNKVRNFVPNKVTTCELIRL